MNSNWFANHLQMNSNWFANHLQFWMLNDLEIDQADALNDLQMIWKWIGIQLEMIRKWIAMDSQMICKLVAPIKNILCEKFLMPSIPWCATKLVSGLPSTAMHGISCTRACSVRSINNPSEFTRRKFRPKSPNWTPGDNFSSKKVWYQETLHADISRNGRRVLGIINRRRWIRRG